MSDWQTTRRKFAVALLGAVGTVAVAGCTDPDTEPQDPEGGGGGGPEDGAPAGRIDEKAP